MDRLVLSERPHTVAISWVEGRLRHFRFCRTAAADMYSITPLPSRSRSLPREFRPVRHHRSGGDKGRVYSARSNDVKVIPEGSFVTRPAARRDDSLAAITPACHRREKKYSLLYSGMQGKLPDWFSWPSNRHGFKGFAPFDTLSAGTAFLAFSNWFPGAANCISRALNILLPLKHASYPIDTRARRASRSTQGDLAQCHH